MLYSINLPELSELSNKYFPIPNPASVTIVWLVFDNFKEEDVYALATKNFTGGFKKTVQVFSEEDQEKLEEMSLKQVAKELQTSFKISHSADDFLFLETLTVTDEKKRYSEKVDTEADEASLSHTGTATVYYIPHSILLTKVQNEKLKDKEFVKDTFELKKTKLEKAKKNEYVYSAQVNGKVQRLIDEKHLAQELAGRLVKQAGETLSNERTVQSYVITFQPIPVPIMPFNPDNIAFEFARQ